MRRTWLASVLLLVLAVPAAAQESAFVSPELYQLLSGEISGDRSYDYLRHLTLHHSTSGGSQGFRDKMTWIAQKARELGFEDVRVTSDLPWAGLGWTPRKAELHILSPGRRRLTSYDEVAVAIADYSRSGTWEGELIDVGAGASDADFEGKDVKGKIVLTTGNPGMVMDRAVWRRGALGVVYYNPNFEYPDQVRWTRLTARPTEGRENTFAFSLSHRAGMELKTRLAPRGQRPGERIVVRAAVEVEFHENATQWIVEGWIRGQRPGAAGEQHIILTAHGQEEKTSANDDNSGCANLLEIGRALRALIDEGKLPRPQRDIRFWWLNELNAQYAWFERHPEERDNVLVNINQDMVGAKQSAGSRIQLISRLPHSRPSFLETVVENVANLVILGNTASLAAGQAGTRQPYSLPIVSRTGTRERYGAAIVPYFGNTDHHAFNNISIGVPAMTLTNWPDDYIHSSDDDLWQMDPTQLARNAFIVAASAWTIATMDSGRAAVLAAEVHAHARRTMAAAFSRATEMLATAAPGGRDAAFHDGINLIDQTARRMAATLDSVRVFKPSSAAARQLDDFRQSMSEAAIPVRASLTQHYTLLTGSAEAPGARPTEEEQAMARKVPELAVPRAQIREKRRGVGGQGLHGLMAFEVWNFVDGQRSYLDIYRAVRAEAQLAGAWYYGNVTAKQVNDLLDAAVKAGALRLK